MLVGFWHSPLILSRKPSKTLKCCTSLLNWWYEFHFQNGELEGLSKKYYKNGEISQEYSYHHGKADGVQRIYCPKRPGLLANRVDGNVEINWVDGKLDAESIHLLK